MFTISNGHALLRASAVAIDDHDTRRQLVACTVAVPHGTAEFEKSLFGTLAANFNTHFTVRSEPQDEHAYGRTFHLTGAQRGYTRMNASMMPLRIRGTAVSMVHPLAGDPQVNQDDKEYFYVLASIQEDPVALFVERLSLGIPWPVLPEWGHTLLERGMDEALVHSLLVGGTEWLTGYCVQRDANAWRDLISSCIRSGELVVAHG